MCIEWGILSDVFINIMIKMNVKVIMYGDELKIYNVLLFFVFSEEKVVCLS